METVQANFFEFLIAFFTLILGAPMGAQVDIDYNTQSATPAFYSGAVESVSGTLDPLSCHCVNGVYLSDTSGVSTPVCLDAVMEEAPSCRYMTVEGVMTSMPGNEDVTSPCPTEGMDVVLASNGVCEF